MPPTFITTRIHGKGKLREKKTVGNAYFSLLTLKRGSWTIDYFVIINSRYVTKY